MGYRIGSFNLHNLGFSAIDKKENKRNLRKIAEMKKEEKFDVVALQEILSEGKAFVYEKETVKKNIIWELGGEREWGFEWADASSKTADTRGEGYAFLWNKRRLRLTTTVLDDGRIREFIPQMLKNVKCKTMRRYPYYARFTPQGTLGGTNFEIRLICIHTHYGDDTPNDRKTRQNELDIVIKEIYPQISDKIYKNDMPHYTIILGDYNVELRRIRPHRYVQEALKGKTIRQEPACLIADDNDEIEVAKWGKCQKVKTVQDRLTTLKKTINPDNSIVFNGNGYSCNYDHFSFEVAQFEGIDWSATKIDAVKKYYNDDFEKYFNEISDHVPIMMEINLK